MSQIFSAEGRRALAMSWALLALALLAGAGIVAMLNYQNARSPVGAAQEYGPSGIQLTLDLNRDYLIGGWTKPELGANPGRCLLLVE